MYESHCLLNQHYLAKSTQFLLRGNPYITSAKFWPFQTPSTHPPYQHKYSTERQQKGPLSKSNHPPSPVADVMQGWPLRFCQAELASPSLSPSSYFLHCSFIIINLSPHHQAQYERSQKQGNSSFLCSPLEPKDGLKIQRG